MSTEGTKHIVLAAIGCPGIVSDDRRSAAITYLNPSKYLNIAEWLESAGVQRVVLFNDLELGCYGVTVTPPEQLHFLSGDLLGGTPDTFMVGMPGTGLGVGFWMNGTPHPSEGGHGLLAISPHDDVESRIWNGLRKKDPSTWPVYDDVACGKGLVSLARILASTRSNSGLNNAPPADLNSIPDRDLPGRLSTWAENPATPKQLHKFAKDVFALFGTFLGRALQIPVLTIMPQALFLAGNITIANLPHFQEQFLTAFQNHRYHSKWLKSLPIALVNNLDLNIQGAVEAAKQNIIR